MRRWLAAADAVIFATDVDVRDRARFAGKPFVASPVKRGIDEPKVMIEEALANGQKLAEDVAKDYQ